MFNRDGLAGPLNTNKPSHQLEPLEPRVLLTTLVGGDVFEYIDAQGQTVRIVLEGDIIAEFIGGDIDTTNNQLILGDLPGVIYSSTLGRAGAINGGLGGADGIELLGQISLTDAFNGAPGNLSGPADGLNIQGISSHPDTQNIWAFNLLTLTPEGEDDQITVVQLIEFDFGTGDGTVRRNLQIPGTFVGGEETNPVVNIVAAAFDPRPGNEDVLYFVVELGDGGGFELRAVDTSTGTLVANRKVLASPGEVDAGHIVSAMTFDQIDVGEYELVIASNRTTTIEGEAAVVGSIDRYSSANDFFAAGGRQSKFITLRADQVLDVTGIAFLGDNSAAADQFLYATTASGQLLKIDLSTGRSLVLGETLDPNDERDTPRGGALTGLTWNADLVNPFTGVQGVLVAVDVATDDLVYLDDRPRFPTADLFAIYVSQSSENAKISIGVVDPFNPDEPDADRPMQPYVGGLGFIRPNIVDEDDEDNLVATPDGVGGLLIGAMTEALEGEGFEGQEDRILIFSADLLESIGVRPQGVDDLPYEAVNLAAGFTVAPSLMQYLTETSGWVDRAVGSNLDTISALASNNFNNITVVNSGAEDQVAQIDPFTGLATSVVTINDGVDNLNGTTGLAYGFGDLTQTDDATDQELYAIINNRFGILNPDTGLFTEIEADITGFGLPSDALVRSMAFGPSGANNLQDLFILADPDATDNVDQTTLYRVSFTTNAGAIDSITNIEEVGFFNDHDLNLDAMTFDSDGRLLAVDRTNGRIVQLSTSTGDLTALSQSPAGSIRTSVTGITYDAFNNRILTVDNAPVADTSSLNTIDFLSSEAPEWADRLMGFNLDLINALAVNRFGEIAVVDIDQSDEEGDTLQGDQIALLNPLTGSALSVVTLNDGVDNLTGTTGLAYGFADLNQINDADDEELYAIVDGAFGIVDPETGLFSAIAADITAIAGDFPALGTVRSIAFGPGGSGGLQNLYILADPNGTDDAEEAVLYRVTYTVNGAGAINALTSIDEVGAGPINSLDLGAMTFDSSGRLLVADRTNGRLVQLNTSTGALTTLADSPAGSLRSTVGGIAYDLVNDRILVADNATSAQVLEDESDETESAALMQIKDGAIGQSIGSVLIGGTLIGQVNISGSVETFYAGWLVTSDSTDEFGSRDSGFYAGGDVRNLIVGSHIAKTETVSSSGENGATEEEYVFYTTTLEVRGRIGQIFTLQDGLFSVEVYNEDTGSNLTAAVLIQQEIETRDESEELAAIEGEAFEAFRLFNGSKYFNDTLETAQVIGTIATGVAGEADIVRLIGSLGQESQVLEQDTVDYYALALTAGQTIALRFSDESPAITDLGIFDPDGRLIASNLTEDGTAVVITAERPGIYTIGVGGFNEQVDELLGSGDYIIEIVGDTTNPATEGPGTLALGGFDIRENYINKLEDTDAIYVASGDIGVLRVGLDMTFDAPEDEGELGIPPQFNDITVEAGDLRAIVAGSIGESPSAGGSGLNANISGNIGLIFTVTGTLTISDTFVGGNIQMIDGVDAVFLRVYVDGGIGVIHAGSMPSGEFGDLSIIQVNFDNIGRDGIIDLIDVEGDLGSAIYGGVQITTGTGGNVRYIRVGGTVYQDTQFSGGDAGVISAPSVSVVDDSGARINLEATSGGNLEVITYGIRGSGGSVIVKVTSSAGMQATASTGANGNSAEISEIVVTGTGNGLIFDPIRQSATLDNRGPESVQAVNIVLGGNSPLDVFAISGTVIDQISNNTSGEIVNIRAFSVGLIYAGGSLGLAKQNVGTAVISREIIYFTFPFDAQRNAIALGDVANIRAGRSIGNVIVDAAVFGDSSVFGGTGSTGTIGNIHANCDNQDIAGVFEGIAGPIYASGDIYTVNIGEGVAASGTGYAAHSGIFATGTIGNIVNQGLGSDIRGTIASTIGIGNIRLNGGGSIIDTEIAVFSDLEMAGHQWLTPVTIFDGSSIGSVALSGNGGIIGTTFWAGTIGNVTVSQGFGIINSAFRTTAGGTLGNFYADGYGFRNVIIGAGVSTGNITAGQRSDSPLSIGNYTASVRASEFDQLNATSNNDLFTALTESFIDRDYIYSAGIIDNVSARGTLDLGTVRAYRIESSSFNYANSTQSIIADENIVNLDLTTGTIRSINAGSTRLRGDIIDSSITVAGNISDITVYGNIDSTDIITNNNGTLNQLNIRKATVGGSYAYDGDFFYRGLRDTLARAGVQTDDLRGLAVRGSDGAVFAVRYNTTTHIDELVQIDPTRGTITVVGKLQDTEGNTYGTTNSSQVISLAFDGNRLLAIVSDTFGANGEAPSVGDDVSLVRIGTQPDSDGFVTVTDPSGFGFSADLFPQGSLITGMAVSNTGDIYIVVDNDSVARLGSSGLVFFPTTFVGTSLTGIGFNDKGVLVGYDENSEQLLTLDLDTGDATSLSNAPDDIEAFAIGNVGGSLINNSSITIAGRSNTITIDGDVDNSTITILSSSSGSFAINRFTLGGNLSGTLDFQDDVNAIIVAGSLGEAGDQLIVNGDLRSLTVGGDRSILGVEMGLDLFVLGDLGSLTVNGIITGDVTVQGTLGRLMATADATQVGGDIISGDINVTETIRSIMTRGGDISGGIYAGRDISMLSITGGSFTDTASATSIFGKIANFTVSGDMDGSISVENGDLSSLRVGGDMGSLSSIDALSIRTLSVTGHIEGGASIIADRIITSITAGYIGDGATAATIMAGGVSSITTRGVRGVNDGDLYADLTLGDSGRASRITAAGNFGGTSSVDGDLMVSVRGDIDMDMTAGEQLVVNGNLTSLMVTGDLSGAILVKGTARTITAGTITDAVITTGQDISSLTSRGVVTDSLIQVGVWAGADQVFTDTDGQQDLGEQARRATLGRFTADRVDNSIIAAAGDFTSVTIRNEALDSSFSSGLSVGSLAISARIAGNTDGDQLRSQDGRELLTGSMRMFSAGTLTNSYVTAGVDAGATGDFATPSVLLDNAFRPQVDGGGFSNIGMIRGVANANTRIVADSGVDRDMTTGNAVVTGNVTYNLADLEGGNALPVSVGIATQGNPLTYTDSGLTITITVRGPGSVDARDVSLVDGVLDGLVITGTTSATTIDISTAVPGTVDLGRVLADDDSALRSFSFDGGIVGDDTDELDVWFDGGISSLSLAGFGTADGLNRVTGSIGGDVATFNLGDQSQGVLRISGAVRTFNITTGSGNSLQINQRQYAGRSFDSLTFDGANVFAHEAGMIYTIDPLNNAGIAGVAVTDATLGTGLTLTGMDIQTGTNNVYAEANVYNQSPTVEVGAINVDLVSLAVRASDGAVFAIRYDADNDVDQLVRIDPITAGITVIGTLQDIFGETYGTNAGSQVMSLAFSGSTLLAIMTDREGAAGGAASVADDVVIASIATTANQQGFVRVVNPNGSQALPPVTLGTNGGEVYSGMAVNSLGHVYAIRDDSNIVRINPSTGADVGGAVAIPGVSLVGIGFDADDNLIGLDSITDQLYLIDLAGPSATALQQGSVADGLTAFAIGKTLTNGGYQVYAYDDVDDIGIAGDERIFYTNPGLTPTLGLVDPATGEFTQFAALAIDEAGTPLDAAVISIAYDSVNDQVKVLTDDGRIITYNNDGTLDTGTDVIEVTSADQAALSQIDYTADGRLIGISTTRQLLVIDVNQGTGSPLTEPGSIRGDITAFAIDEVTGLGLVFNNDNEQVASLAGFNQQSLGGITANTISRLTLGDGYSNRIAAIGNLDMVSSTGDFDGAISTGGTIRSLMASGGEFSGSVYAAGDISRATLRDVDFTEDALIHAGNKLSLDVSRGANFDGLLDGTVYAGNLVNLRSTGIMTSNATILVGREAASISLGGDFAGNMSLPSVTRSMIISGRLLTGSEVLIAGDAPTLTINGGAQTGSLLMVDGSVRSLTVGGTFSGVIGVGRGLQRGSFDNINAGLVSVGLDTLSFMARGNVISSVLSFGTQLGADGTYNTNDDVITGGIVRMVSISGDYRDSIIAAGVLPSFNLGGFTPGVTSNLAFLGNSAAANIVDRDSAEASGLLATSIDSLSIRGEISSTNIGTGRVAGVAAADNIGRITTGQTGNILQQRVYTDPFGGVEIIATNTLSPSSFEIVLSEELATSTISVSQDLDDDQIITAGDIFGSLIIYDGNGDVVDNASLTYSTRVINNVQRSVIRVTAPTTFAGGTYDYDYFPGFVAQEDLAQSPVLMDRSGVRSAMVNFNNDPFGTQIQ